MNYEKKYNEALERAKNLRKDAIDMGEDIRAKQCEIIFPELNESDDERIRKAILEGLIDCRDAPDLEWTNFGGIKIDDCIAWIEKQGEQKNKINSYKITFEDVLALECSMKTAKITKGGDELYKILVPLYNKIHNVYLLEKQGEQNIIDKVEPKFHKGDWVILTAGELSTILQIVNVDTNKKLYWFNDSSYLPIVDEECLRLWTIQDAKDGDVLVSKYEQPFIYNGNYDEYNVGGYCGIVCDGSMFIETDTICQWADNKKIKPATNAQHDLLFQKMKEAGYEWDNEKKELKKIVTNGGDFCESENCGQKSTWSEVDEYMLDETIQHLKLLIEIDKVKHCACDVQYYQRDIDWLKSLKQRMGG